MIETNVKLECLPILNSAIWATHLGSVDEAARARLGWFGHLECGYNFLNNFIL